MDMSKLRLASRFAYASGLVVSGLLLSALFPSTASAVGTRTFDLGTKSDFEGGDLKGVAIDSAGRVRAGLNLGKVGIEGADTVWSSLLLKDGTLLLGTGNEGKLISLKGAKTTVLAETKTMAITSMVEAWGGAVILGTLPGGEVKKWERGKLTTLAKLPNAKHIWALAYDEKARVVYAATGPEGKVYRISQQGQAQVFMSSDEKHLMSVAVSPDGKVYVGGGEKGKLYQVEGGNKAPKVVYDFAATEVRGIAFGAGGLVYAIANEISAGSYASYSSGLSLQGPTPSPPTTRGKGMLYVFDKEGAPEKLYEDSSEHFVTLTMGDDGKPYVGTGAEGRIYTVDDAHNSVLIGDVEERQVSSLVMSGKDKYIIASDPVVVHPVRGVGGPDAVWTSKVLDANLRATFGRMTWEADGVLEFSTRTGNTKDPDDSWSPWSGGITAPADVKSPAGRFIQVRARWSKDPKAELTEVTLPFITDNLKAVVTNIDVKVKSNTNPGMQSSGGPVNEKPSTKVNLTWRVDNPDNDILDYHLEYRLVGTTTYYPLEKPNEKVTSPNYSWETGDLPEGKYRVRVTASDAPSNTPSRVKRHRLESNVIIVDNTPPAIKGLASNGRHITGTAVDGVGPIQRIEISVAGTNEWFPFDPKDGIYDEAKEEFDADVTPIAGKGPVMMSVRVYDSAANTVVMNVALK